MALSRTTQTRPFLLSLIFLSLLLLQKSSAFDFQEDQDINAIDFIRTNCNSTLYPGVCYASLSRYANTIQQSPEKLARVAVAVSLSRARHIAAYIRYLSRQPTLTALDQATVAVLKDCSSTFGDAIDQMRRSNSEMLQLDLTSHSSESLRFLMSDVQTWMSAALTNEDTCTDEFDDLPDGSVKSDVCDRITKGRKLTSNALALINRFVEATEAEAPVTTP